jgi:hypothetical protein
VSRSIRRATPMILRAVEQVDAGAAWSAQLRRPEAGQCYERLYGPSQFAEPIISH